MDYIKQYSKLIKKNIGKPNKAKNLIKLGLTFENFRVNHLQEKNIPEALKYLNQISLQYVLEPLKCPKNSAWVNLFSPCEILHAMDIYPVLIEGYSSFMSGLKCEDMFIDLAENEGIAETLCSYHKGFIGAADSGVLSKPNFAITTSLACDANVNTFRYLSEKNNIPYYIIDVPYSITKDSLDYVTNQLKEMIKMMEDIMGKKLEIDKLKKILENENSCTTYRIKYLKSLANHYYPNTLTLEMYMLFTSHTFMGRNETLKFYKMLSEDILKYPKSNGKRIFWTHLIPFYHEVLKKYFNMNPDKQIIGIDMNYDYIDMLDINNPLESLSRKLILNQFNGSFQRKIDNIMNLIDITKPDGVINFSHWGCRQSSGGVRLLKDAVHKKGLPFLSLDGDGMDRRNSPVGQMNTRLEAFFEILEKERNDA